MNLKKMRRPEWLKKSIDFKRCRELDSLFIDLGLKTVCREAFCPNMSECFSEGVATFLILGNKCTRGCSFCAVGKGVPEPPDPGEPRRIAEAVLRLGLKHVVITSVTRDDLPDGGATAFIDNIHTLRKAKRDINIEVLTPDFKGNIDSVKKIINARPDIFAHNIETVQGLYSTVRRGSDYKISLAVLEAAKKIGGEIYTKSGIMLGLGETEGEVLSVFRDLNNIGCDFLSIGQYLSPGPGHHPVKEYIRPEKFAYYKEEAESAGFRFVESSPYTRSSYMAHKYLGVRSPHGTKILSKHFL